MGRAMRVDPAYYRKQAKLSRELAAKAPDVETEETLLNVAMQYDQLAEEAEKTKAAPAWGIMNGSRLQCGEQKVRDTTNNC